MTITTNLGFSTLTVDAVRLGEDILVSIRGGDRPHIGCAVLAVPRPSLTGDGGMSCTSSVLNVTGHRDDEICRYLAEKVCRKYGVTVVCTGGFHCDHMTAEQIRKVMQAVQQIEL